VGAPFLFHSGMDFIIAALHTSRIKYKSYKYAKTEANIAYKEAVRITQKDAQILAKLKWELIEEATQIKDQKTVKECLERKLCDDKSWFIIMMEISEFINNKKGTTLYGRLDKTLFIQKPRNAYSFLFKTG
jgi:uncharacterized protein YbcC (UPF0753/DUF2309 family)